MTVSLLASGPLLCSLCMHHPFQIVLAHTQPAPSVLCLQERRVTTHIEVVRDGQDGSDLFYSLLIDDPDDLDTPAEQQQQQQGAAGVGGPTPSPTGVDQFIQHIKAEVVMQLQPH